MIKLPLYQKLAISLLVIFFIGTPAFAQETAIARVISTKGLVQAKSTNGELRDLVRRSEVFAQDTIITGDDGFAQLRLIDAGMISLKAETEFTFEEYSFDGAGGSPDSAIMTLIRGGFRTISGTIGEDDQDDYRIDTPFASIGIRGTTHEALIDSGQLFTGVYDGGTTISNNMGAIDTGIGANFDYTMTLQNQAPIGLLQQPIQLGQIDTTPGSESNDRNPSTNNINTALAGAGSTSNTEPPTINQTREAQVQVTARTEPFFLATPIGQQISRAESLREISDISDDSVPPTPTLPTTPTLPATPTTPPVITPVLDDAALASAEQRLGFTLSRNFSPEIFTGNTSTITNDSALLLVGNDQTNPRTVDSEADFIFEGVVNKNNFFTESITSANQSFNHDVQWGVWGSSSNPLNLFLDFQDSASVQAISDPLLWLSVLPSPIADLTGNAHFASTAKNFAGGSSLGGSLNNLLVSFNVNFENGLISDGVLDFCIGGDGLCQQQNAQNWEVDFTGSVTAGVAHASPDSISKINGQAIEVIGSIQGAFTGENITAFAGAFNLQSNPVDDAILPATLVDAVFLIERDDRITHDELLSLQSDSFLVQEAYKRIFLGNSDKTQANSNPILFRDSVSTPNIILRDLSDSPRVSITRENEGLSDFMSYGVNWQQLNGPLNTFSNNFDANDFQDGALDMNADIAFLSTFKVSKMLPTLGQFSEVLAFIGTSEDGQPIDYFDMHFDIDFSNGLISNGDMSISLGNEYDTYTDYSEYTHSSEQWDIYFDGQIANNIIEFNILEHKTDLPHYTTGVNGSNFSEFEGSIKGAIVDNGEDFAALSSFYFTDKSNNVINSVSGQVLVKGFTTYYRDDRLSISELSELNERVGLIAEYGSDKNILLGASTDSSQTSPKIAINSNVADDIYNFSLFTSPSELVLSDSNPISIEHKVHGFNVDWGEWNTDGRSVKSQSSHTDKSQLDASFNKELYWAATQAADIADLRGTMSFNATGYQLGSGNDGAIDNLSISFDADFGTGGITNGRFSAATNGGSSWEFNYTGSIHESRAQMQNFSNMSLNDSPTIISGDVKGVFTTLENATGFVSGFTLNAGENYINGVGLSCSGCSISTNSSGVISSASSITPN